MSETRTADLTAQVDGVTVTYTTADPYIAGSLVLFINGVQQAMPPEDTCYDETIIAPGVGQGFTMDTVLRFSDEVRVQYEVEDTASGFPIVVASGSDPTEC